NREGPDGDGDRVDHRKGQYEQRQGGGPRRSVSGGTAAPVGRLVKHGSAGRVALRALSRHPIVQRLSRSANVTQTENRFFDEMAKLFNDAASVAQGVRREAESVFRTQVERLIADLDLVKREDFEVVREMVSKMR